MSRKRPSSNARPRRAAVVPITPARPVLEVIRLSRVNVARRRIQEGFYDRGDVRRRLAEAVLEELDRD